jgi:GAF domain-containing protein
MHEGIRFFESGLQLVKGNGDLKTALGELIQLAAQDANCNSASFYIADWKVNRLKPVITYGLPASYVEACGEVTIGDQCCGRAVQHRKPWMVQDMLSDPLFASAKSAALVSPIRAAFSVPVMDEAGACLGSLACHYRDVHVATPSEIKGNETWARLIAHAISQHQAPLADPALSPDR